MLKKIQLLSLAVATCVSTAALAQQTTPPSSKNIAVLTPTLTVESKRTFGTLPKTTLSLKHDDANKSDFVEIDITGNTAAAKLGVKSDKGALVSGTNFVKYDLKVTIGAQENTLNLDSLVPKSIAEMNVSDSDNKLKVTTTVQPNQNNPQAGTYTDTVTLTLTDA